MFLNFICSTDGFPNNIILYYVGIIRIKYGRLAKRVQLKSSIILSIFSVYWEDSPTLDVNQ